MSSDTGRHRHRGGNSKSRFNLGAAISQKARKEQNFAAHTFSPDIVQGARSRRR
jgi:hypothetical protein